MARSRAGRAWQAVRDNEVAASIMGVNLFTTKMGAFILSSFLAGIAGALYASLPWLHRSQHWSLVLSIQFIAAMLIGGPASVWGSILGAAFVFALPTALETFSLLPQSAGSGAFSSGNLSAILYGLLIIVFLLFEPAGIIGLHSPAPLFRPPFRYAKQRRYSPAHGAIGPESQLDVEYTHACAARRCPPGAPN